MNQNLGKIIGWIAILAGIIGLFWQSYIMGGIAIALGIIGFFLKSSTKQMNVTAIVIGLVAFVIEYISY